MSKPFVLFDFSKESNIQNWIVVNDGVMGGLSKGNFSIDNEGHALFKGYVSLENNGGFASIRSQWTPYDLKDFDGILLRVRGDGKIYRFRIRTEQTGSNISYTALFSTEENKWQEVYIPFSEMVPLYRGFIVNDAGPLSPASIRSFGFMLADKQQGEFMLEVDQISAVNK